MSAADNEILVSIVTNAIAFELLSGDGREVVDVDGSPVIDVSLEELEPYRRAARRVLRHLEEAANGPAVR